MRRRNPVVGSSPTLTAILFPSSVKVARLPVKEFSVGASPTFGTISASVNQTRKRLGLLTQRMRSRKPPDAPIYVGTVKAWESSGMLNSQERNPWQPAFNFGM